MERDSLILNVILWDGDHTSFNFKNWTLKKNVIDFIFYSKTDQKVQRFLLYSHLISTTLSQSGGHSELCFTEEETADFPKLACCPLETAGQDGNPVLGFWSLGLSPIPCLLVTGWLQGSGTRRPSGIERTLAVHSAPLSVCSYNHPGAGSSLATQWLPWLALLRSWVQSLVRELRLGCTAKQNRHADPDAGDRGLSFSLALLE